MLAFLRHYGWALLSGILLSWAFPTFHFYPLAWFALTPLLVQSQGGDKAHAARQFFIAGWIFHTIVLQWLTANIFWAGGWAILGQQVICAALGGYWALLGVLWCWMSNRWPGVRAALFFGACWISMEWLQARLFTGFAWAALGYSQGPDLPFAQLASLGGVILLSGILAVVNAALAQAWQVKALRVRGIALAVVVFALAHGGGYALLAPARAEGDYGVGMYQSNYSQHMKWDPDFQQEMLQMAFDQSGAVLEREPARLFVWPEALIMDDFRQPEVLSALQAFAGSTQTAIFAGAVREEGTDSFNSSVLVRPDGTYEWYDKIKLAPFGEYIPLESWLSFVENFGASGGIASGAEHKVMEVGERRFGPLICFEVLFSPLASACRALGADYLVVITNLGWFGGSNVLGQELEIARFRAIENRLPVVQCANTGVSGVIDAWGRQTVIDGVINRRGAYVTAQNPLEPADAMLVRRVGVLPLPESGRMLLPGSVDWFGRLVPIVTGLLLAWGLWRERRVSTTAAETGR